MTAISHTMLTGAAALLAMGCGAPAVITPPQAADLSAPAPDLQTPAFDLARTDDGGGCPDDLGERALGGSCVISVTGRLVDENNGPIAAAFVTVCAGGCFYGTTNDGGDFTVPVAQYIVVANYSLLAHVNPRRAAFYLSLPAPAGGTIHFDAPIPTLAMPLAGPEIRRDQSAQHVEQNGVTLDIDAGTTLFFSIEDSAEPQVGSLFRPLRLTEFSRLPFLAGLAPLVVYGFGPFEIDFRKPAHVSLPNDLGLAAGAAVEMLGQRGLLRGGPPGARFDVVATAHVSLDGTRINMDPGSGLDTLTWIALRKKGM